MKYSAHKLAAVPRMVDVYPVRTQTIELLHQRPANSRLTRTITLRPQGRRYL